jgi:CheY-like chemotaxis protein
LTRLVLVHWNSVEAEARAAALRAAGHSVVCHSDPKSDPHRLLIRPPDAFLIDLERLPSQGRELGGFLRRSAATRRVPLLFLEGDPAKTERVRALLPDAAFTTWERIDDDLAATLALTPAQPVVPGAMDAYAGVPLIQKLGVKASSLMLLVGAPAGFEHTLGALPGSARVTRNASQAADIVLLFAASRDALEAGFEGAAAHVQDGGRLWILWQKTQPRGAARRLAQTDVRAIGLARGWVDYKVSAIDETWSGLCFARRPASGKEPAR